MKTIDITRMPANFVPDIHDILVVKDSDELFPVEILNSVPEAAKHWDEYNDKNLWDKKRFKNTKYVIGDPYDYSYEEVDAVLKEGEIKLEKEENPPKDMCESCDIWMQPEACEICRMFNK